MILRHRLQQFGLRRREKQPQQGTWVHQHPIRFYQALAAVVMLAFAVFGVAHGVSRAHADWQGSSRQITPASSAIGEASDGAGQLDSTAIAGCASRRDRDDWVGTWATALTEVRQALNFAGASSGAINEIWVAAGEYYPAATAVRSASFVIPSGVKLYGGFDGTETQLGERDWEANVTTLSGDPAETATLGDNCYHVIEATGSRVSAKAPMTMVMKQTARMACWDPVGSVGRSSSVGKAQSRAKARLAASIAPMVLLPA